MVDYQPRDKATTGRLASTANFFISSEDRDNVDTTSPYNFQVNKINIAQGYFTRIGVSEVVLDWCNPNIFAAAANNFIGFLITPPAGDPFTINVELDDDLYNVAQALDTLVIAANDELITAGSPIRFSIDDTSFPASFVSSGGQFQIRYGGQGSLSHNLFHIDEDTDIAASYPIDGCADIQLCPFIDIICRDLTQHQGVRDVTTAQQFSGSDVICRWYFAEEGPESYDKYGYPILQGYNKFIRRRIFSQPKQIKWEPTASMGALTFTIADDYNRPPNRGDNNHNDSKLYMTLQLSEN